MCAVQIDFYTGLNNGGDGEETIQYDLAAPPGDGNFTCYERDTCDPGVTLAPALGLSQWAALCQAGETYTTVSNPFGYSTTDWVNSFTHTYACQTISPSCVGSPPPPPPPCGPAPATASRTVACVAPQTGPGYTQTHCWTATSAPTCWVAAPWATTGGSCTTPPPLPVCAKMISVSYTTMEEYASYRSVVYSINGVESSCYTTAQDPWMNGKKWSDVIANNACSGFISRGTWAASARVGDFYEADGDDGCCQGAATDPYAWTTATYERWVAQTCTSTGNYDFITESCAAETNYALPSLDTQARAACNGASVGASITNLHYFPSPSVGCYADVVCK